MTIKRVLFASPSQLSHNLLRSLIPYVKARIELDCCEEISSIESGHLPKKPCALLLLDGRIFSSEGKGLEGVKDLRQKGAFKNARCAVFVSPEDKFQKEDLLQTGPARFYTKPFLPEELIRLIEEGLGR